VPYLAAARTPLGEVSYAVRGKVDRNRLIGVQHYDHPEFRLLALWEVAQKRGLHIYSTEECAVCAPDGPAPPQEYVDEAISLLPYDLDDSGNCPHVREGRGIKVHWTSAKTTLTFWTHTHPPMVDLNKELIAEFEKQNPDIDIQYTAIPNSDFFTKMLAAMSTGTGPDVFNMSATRITAYLENKMAAPVNPAALGFKNQDELVKAWQPGTLGMVTDGGKVYGIPSEYNVSALVINKKHFHEAGLDPNKPPKTWDELMKYAEKLTVRKGNQIVRRGFDFYYLPNFYWLDFGVLSLQFRGHILNAAGTESVINSKENVAALRFWYDMVHKEKVAGPQYSMKDSTNTMIDFANGSVSMFLCYPWGLGLLQDSPVWKDVVVVPLP
jgi:ABC-type glycerol-3-phosphate transport system substrate-binding protein